MKVEVGNAIAKKRHTDGGNDCNSVEQSTSEGPLQLRLVRVVVSIPALILHRVANLVLERPQNVYDTSREVLTLGVGGQCGGGALTGSRPSPLTAEPNSRLPDVDVRHVRRQSPDVVRHAAAEVDDLQLDAVLEGRLKRAEEEAAHDGVRDDHAGETDVGEEERRKLLATGDDPLTLAPMALSTSLAVEHLPRHFAVQPFHRHVTKPRDWRAGRM